jgi:hypothetical protein
MGSNPGDWRLLKPIVDSSMLTTNIMDILYINKKLISYIIALFFRYISDLLQLFLALPKPSRTWLYQDFFASKKRSDAFDGGLEL